MGEVYRAEDTRLNRTVAIKILPAHVAADPVRRERFDREARTIATLTHPHICTLYDVGHQDGVDCLVLEHLEGETLEARLRAGPLPLDQALRYGIELADALDQAHRRGIVHRDLKPANIIVTSTGVKLLDFGLAQLRQREALSFERGGQGETTSLTAEGTILGTLQYMAPEQIEGRGNDQRADLFALGAVLYEMATGEKAFRGDSPAGQMAAVLTSEPPPVSTVRPEAGLPRAFDHLVQRCLAKDPEARWQSARDVMLELTWMARAAPSADVQREGFARDWLRGRVGWAVAAVLAVVTVGLAAVVVWQSNRAKVTSSTPTLVEPYVFTIAPPDNAVLSPDAYSMAMSPDGRSLAFTASLGGGRPFLWIRSLVSSTTTMSALQHTEGAAAPFWSPDSQSIAFVADGKLKRIDVDSETVREVADDASPIPGAWGQEGVILFPNSGHDIFYKVSAEGGPVTPATELNHARKEVAHQWAYFLPDGHRFLFVAFAGEGTSPSLSLASLDSKDRIRTIPVESADTRYVEPGYLLWHRGSTLFARSFDLATFQPTGPPSAIAEHLRYNRGTDAVFSASSTGIAYREVQTTRLAWLDRRGREVGFIEPPGAYSDLALSPDGKKLAVCQFDRDAGRRDIWLYDIEGNKWSRLSSNPADDVWPVWSSDSRRILFASNRNGYFDLFVRTVEQGAAEQLVEGIPPKPHKWPIDWTSDGRVLYRDGMARGALILPAGGKPTDAPPRIAETGISDKLSPDGRWLAFTAGWTSSAGVDLFVAPFPAGDKTWRISSGGGAQPRWRQDGKELFYLARDGRLMAMQVNTTHGFQAGQPQPLFQTTLPFIAKNAPESRNTYSVTPDGQRFLLNEPVGGDTPITALLNWTAKLPRLGAR
jgi:eukaryotic-like serine/threonine-protein kinase